MGVKEMRQFLQEAAIRFTAVRDLESAMLLDQTAEAFAEARRRARVRRDKWKERQALQTMGDGIKTCRVQGCKLPAEWRPVLSFPPLDGGNDRIRVDTALLDVCDAHSRDLGVDCYTENPAVWAAVIKVWEENGLSAPDPDLAQVDYVRNGVIVDG